MMRHSLLSMAGAILLVTLHTGGKAAAEPAQSGAVAMPAATATPRVEEFSAQSRETTRHRKPRRVHIYTPRGPGPNSVRICHSYYEYEYRLSGTVIVPRESCYWQG
ncbi:hypothetical protein [Afipia sp. 1NLS2]|jgi:hypothetical protein|uniref:hypothetical protein n=1 Tax=Afipia sp. 1NLS2 TaxID=666684 RepID=UPI0012EAD25C|nr:hypothetical protein [Afipia sp. 1NLS2]MBE0701942.1 hypothetical protein [Afipia sp.]